MLRRCRQCRVEYDGDPGSTLCPSCARAGKKSTVRDRICWSCAEPFPGGPRARYCPDCRRERQREQSREYQQRKAAGAVRKIGSTDSCAVCGRLYTVASGLQKYCPDCAPLAVAEADRRQGRDWYAVHGDPAVRRQLRQAQTVELTCIVCGAHFKPAGRAVTCSPACARIYRRDQCRSYELSHRESRNRQHRERTKARVDAMTPQEREEYRANNNASARINYKKRKNKEI